MFRKLKTMVIALLVSIKEFAIEATKSKTISYLKGESITLKGVKNVIAKQKASLDAIAGRATKVKKKALEDITTITVDTDKAITKVTTTAERVIQATIKNADAVITKLQHKSSDKARANQAVIADAVHELEELDALSKSL